MACYQLCIIIIHQNIVKVGIRSWSHKIQLDLEALGAPFPIHRSAFTLQPLIKIDQIQY